MLRKDLSIASAVDIAIAIAIVAGIVVFGVAVPAAVTAIAIAIQDESLERYWKARTLELNSFVASRQDPVSVLRD